MNRTTTLLPALIATLFTFPAHAETAPLCTSARAGMHVAAQPDAWRMAVNALLASTASPGQPWSCVGGEVDLEVNSTSAILTVIDDQGHAVSREVTSPDDVAPLGEALLSKPLIKLEPAPSPPITPEPESTAARDPRLLLAATMGPRYAGPSHLMWGSLNVLAAVPFRPWGAGIWIRYDGFSTALDEPIPPIRDLCIGAAGDWSKSFGRVEFRPMLRPSLAIVTRRIAISNGPTVPGSPSPKPIFRDDTEFDFRLGGDAQILIGMTKRLRAVIGLDAEVSPGHLVSTFNRRRGGDLPSHVPAYTVGIGLGVEVSVP